ncbi:MAG: hypothetical protein ACKVP7_03580 [Hyphomicrobiaceae bacterium]
MLSGTQLVLLAMYSTVNVVGPAGAHLDLSLTPAMMCLLIAAAVMTCWQAYALSSPPQRPMQKGPKFRRLNRVHAGPAPRRV